MPKIDLKKGQILNNQWEASGWVFFQRYVVLGLIYLFIFGGFRPFRSILDWLITIPILLLHGTIWGGFRAWTIRRRDVWILTSQRLAYFGLDDEIGNVFVPLEHITSISHKYWWGLTLKTRDGNKISMKFLESPRDIKKEILMARDIVLERSR